MPSFVVKEELPVTLQLLTVKQVAKLLQMSRTSLNRMIKRNEIPSLKIRGGRRFHPDKISRWLDRHEKP